jgi:hypothetical protein
MQTILVSALMLLAGAVIINGQGSKSKHLATVSTNTLTVDFCELIQHPDRYDQKLVRIQAIEAFDMENAFLYDPVCSVVGTYVWASSGCSSEKSCERTRRLIGKNLRLHKEYGVSRVAVIAVGRFKGPSEKGYGHLDGYKFSFDFMKIETVTPVPTKTPWPWEIKK